MSVEILSLIISVCSFMSVEDPNGKWMKADKIEVLQAQCREYYYDCMNKSGANTEQQFIVCDKSRRRK